MERSAVGLATCVRTPLSESHVAHLKRIGEIVHFAPQAKRLWPSAPAAVD